MPIVRRSISWKPIIVITFKSTAKMKWFEFGKISDIMESQIDGDFEGWGGRHSA